MPARARPRATAVGRGGAIVTTTDLVTWTVATSNTTNMLNSVLCLSTTFCIAVGQNGTVDVFNGTTWTATTGNGGTGMLADVDCDGNLVCYATGKQGITLLTTTGGTTWTMQAGGGTTQQMNGISCPNDGTCYAAGNAGTILKTTNGGQTWSPQTSGTTQNLNGISCSDDDRVRHGRRGDRRRGDRPLHDRRHRRGTAARAPARNALNGVACTSATACLAVGAAGTIIGSADGGATWTPKTSGTTNALNAIACPRRRLLRGRRAAAGAAVSSSRSTAARPGRRRRATRRNALSGVACVNAGYCFADGAVGTTIATGDGGTTWAQQGNPISGPTTAINATNIALNGAGCTSARCFVGLGAQGDILTTPLLTVTVHATGVYGSTPSISLPAIEPADLVLAGGRGGERDRHAHVHDDGRGREPGRVVPDHELHRARGRRLQRRLRLREQQLHRDQGAADGDGGQQVAAVRPGQPAADGDAQRLRARPDARHLGRHRRGGLHDDRDAVPTGGSYPITCTQGTLTAANYSFGPFVPGTLTVGYSQPCITGAAVAAADGHRGPGDLHRPGRRRSPGRSR